MLLVDTPFFPRCLQNAREKTPSQCNTSITVKHTAIYLNTFYKRNIFIFIGWFWYNKVLNCPQIQSISNKYHRNYGDFYFKNKYIFCSISHFHLYNLDPERCAKFNKFSHIQDIIPQHGHHALIFLIKTQCMQDQTHIKHSAAEHVLFNQHHWYAIYYSFNIKHFCNIVQQFECLQPMPPYPRSSSASESDG